MPFTVAKRAKRPFRSPILEWKGNGRLYVATELAQHNQKVPNSSGLRVESSALIGR